MRTYICIILICFLYICQCHHPNKVNPNDNDSLSVDTTEIVMGMSVDVQHAHTLPTCTLSIEQVDSMIMADKLPVLSKWTKNQFKDYETATTTDYMTLFDKTTNTVYTVKTLNRRQYVVSKRLIK